MMTELLVDIQPAWWAADILSGQTPDTQRRCLSLDLQFFAKEGPGGEKTEEPTDKKLRDARDEGNVAKSQEINQALSLLALFLMLRFLTGWLGDNFRGFFTTVYEDIPYTIQMYDGQMPFSAIRALVTSALLHVLLFIAPFLIVGFMVAFLSDLVQVKWHVTTKPLKPKFSKMNPISGFSKIVSKRKLFDLLKSILKLGLLGIVVWSYITDRRESIFLLYDMPLRQCLEAMYDILINLGIRIALVYMIIAAADYLYQKHKFHEDMKMTKQEVKDEYKSTEGDPQIKGKIRQRMMESSRRRMMQALPQADVVITNPTHYAVALKYDQDKYKAPVVIAKGADHLAAKIREAAGECGIEIVEDKPLARMLYANVPLGTEIPPELYEAVANVLAFVYKIKGKI